jgi:integrase/recombinase XerC
MSQNYALTTELAPEIQRAGVLWLDEKANRSGSAQTRRAYADTLKGFMGYLMAQGVALDGDKHQVAEAAQVWAGVNNAEPGKPVSPATYNQRLTILSSFYKFCLKSEVLEHNPIDLVARRTNHPYQGSRALDAKDIKKALKAIDRADVQGQRDYALLLIAATTGRRATELASLRWRDLQIVGNEILITWSRCKGGKVMHDRLDAKVSSALLTYLHSVHGAGLGSLPADTPLWVRTCRNAAWQNEGRALAPLTYRAISDICKKHLGTSRVHSLRHTFAHEMIAAGAGVNEIKDALGHESLDTTSRYLKSIENADRPHAAALADVFGAGD